MKRLARQLLEEEGLGVWSLVICYQVHDDCLTCNFDHPDLKLRLDNHVL